MRENLKYRILAVVLAVFTWHLVSGREVVDTWVEVPVEVTNLPKNMVIREGMVNRIEVRIRGPRGLVRGLVAKDLVYSMNLEDLSIGRNPLIFDPDNLGLSRALEVMEINPSRIELSADVTAKRQLPVEVVWEGQLDAEYRFIEARTEPALVELKGPASVLNSLDRIVTHPVLVTSKPPRLVREKVNLVIPPEIEIQPRMVEAKITFGPKLEAIWVKRPIRTGLLQNKNARITPNEVRLLVDMPVPLLKDENWRETIVVSVENDRRLRPGEHQLSFVVKLPKDATLLDAKPESITVIVPEPVNATGN